MYLIVIKVKCKNSADYCNIVTSNHHSQIIILKKSRILNFQDISECIYLYPEP